LDGEAMLGRVALNLLARRIAVRDDGCDAPAADEHLGVIDHGVVARPFGGGELPAPALGECAPRRGPERIERVSRRAAASLQRLALKPSRAGIQRVPGARGCDSLGLSSADRGGAHARPPGAMAANSICWRACAANFSASASS